MIKPSDRKRKLSLRILAVLGILIFYLLVTGFVLVAISKNGRYLSVSESAQFPGGFLLQSLFVSAVPILLLAVCAACMKKDFAGLLYLRIRGKTQILGTVGLAAILSGMTVLGFVVNQSWATALLGLHFYLVVVAFPEELIWRGVCAHLLREESRVCRFLVPNLCFALGHIFNLGFPALRIELLPSFFLVTVPVFTVLGCLFQYLKEKTGTLWIPVLLHAIIDYRFVFQTL